MLIIVLRYWASFILVNGSFNAYQISNSIYGYHGIEIKFNSEKIAPLLFHMGAYVPWYQQTDISLELHIDCTHNSNVIAVGQAKIQYIACEVDLES